MGAPIKMHVYDEDRVGLDDWMGLAELHLAHVVDDPLYYSAYGGPLTLRLSSRGTIELRLRLELCSSAWTNAERIFSHFVLEPLHLKDVGPLQLRRDFTTVRRQTPSATAHVAASRVPAACHPPRRTASHTLRDPPTRRCGSRSRWLRGRTFSQRTTARPPTRLSTCRSEGRPTPPPSSTVRL